MTRSASSRTLLTSALATAVAAALLAPLALAQTPFKILSETKVGGEGGFDYVAADSVDRRLYIARSGPEGTLNVFDMDSLKQLGTIPVGSAHGAAIDTELHHGFATSTPVTMFDTKTMQVIKKLDTAGRPDGYLTDEKAHRVYILSHAAPNVTVLDAHDGSIVGTIDLGGAPEEAELDGKGHLYVDLEDKDAIGVVDTATLKMTGRYDVSSVAGGCAGLAIDRKHGILFATCRDKSNMVILRAEDGKILTTLPTGAGSDGATFDPATDEAFSTQGDGTLTIVKEDSPTSFHVEQTLKTAYRAKTLALDSKSHHIFTITGDFTPPAAGAMENGRPARPQMVPGSFKIIVIGR